jgi:hypothetical protein
MKKTAFWEVGILLLLPLLIYYPMFTANYSYTDEYIQLWYNRNSFDYPMYLPQGRLLMEYLMHFLFNSIQTIEQIKWVRLFSLGGWLLCIPIWYGIIKKIVVREGLPALLPFCTVLYLITSPGFVVSIQWAVCAELFLANTAGLLSGYLLYCGIKEGPGKVSKGMIVLSVVLAMISLFTYQSGFGCFFIPSALHLLSAKRVTNRFWIHVLSAGFLFALYFVLFKCAMALYHITPDPRAGLTTNPFGKLIFFFRAPLASAFHFTFLIYEKNYFLSFIPYVILFGSWLGYTYFVRLSRLSRPRKEKVYYIGALGVLCILSYLPGLLVKENFASNRTVFSLDIIVFIMVFESVNSLFILPTSKRCLAYTIGLLFLVNAHYNFTRNFLFPVTSEYKAVRGYIEQHYQPGMSSVYFIRPQEDALYKKYGVTRSWDEFGVPSTSFAWVPEVLVRQVVFENYKDRSMAQKLLITSWLGRQAYEKENPPLGDSVLVIDVEKLIQNSR